MARGGEALNGFVDTGCTIRGELEFAESFRLDGRVEGQVRSTAELVVGERGVVDGEIDVARCLVGGEVHGTIRASERVILHGTAKVWADIHTPALVMEDGALLEGRVVMGAERRETKAAGKEKEVETKDPKPEDVA
jgi:cytoskeletal protein CcmA (bactofilin family)